MSIVGNLWANFSLTSNLKFDLISQSRGIVFQANHNTACSEKAVRRMACLTFLTTRLPISCFFEQIPFGNEMFLRLNKKGTGAKL